MTYEEFKGIAPVGEQDLYLQEIINNVTPSFYENNLVNNDTSINYMTFLKEQTAEIDE
ncbi:MAG: hypothetical protein LBQ24_07165 [Candidatus Peribacteria bacterium]|jgi:hypothetical protein|nr:hypothetical protein [Candidatus Peribacteria bacterium]